MLKLELFPPGLLGIPNASPFGMKAEILLKMSRLPFEVAMGDVRGAPKKKLPILIDGDKTIPDSTFIRLHLETEHGIDFDNGYSVDALATAWAVEKMLEDHLYWLIVYERWMVDENFEKGPATFFDEAPPVLRGLIKNMIRNKTKRDLFGNGIAQHSDDERAVLIEKSLSALSAALGENTYLLGDKPCGVDATVFGMLASTLCDLFDGPLRTHTLAHDNLVAYHDRMMAEFYPGFEG